jgi:hypothetical protein
LIVICLDCARLDLKNLSFGFWLNLWLKIILI